MKKRKTAAQKREEELEAMLATFALVLNHAEEAAAVMNKWAEVFTRSVRALQGKEEEPTGDDRID